MPTIALSEARVKALRPRASAYDIRDAKLKGFGVRILPSGTKRFFIHSQHRGQRIWNIVGDADAMTVHEARARAASLLAAIRRDGDAPASPDATRFEAVAETVFRRYARAWKPQRIASRPALAGPECHAGAGSGWCDPQPTRRLEAEAVREED